jgi:hypothetical protein
MAALARYPLSISLVLAAFAATAAVFLFARPQYHPKGEGNVVRADGRSQTVHIDETTPGDRLVLIG